MYQTPGVWTSKSKSFHSLDLFGITKKQTFLNVKMSLKAMLIVIYCSYSNVNPEDVRTVSNF